MGARTLAQLEQTFLLPPPAPGANPSPILFSGNSELFPCMDGAYYFKQVSDAIDACVSAGDAIYVTSWFSTRPCV